MAKVSEVSKSNVRFLPAFATSGNWTAGALYEKREEAEAAIKSHTKEVGKCRVIEIELPEVP